jgi:hypothetical protein
MKEPLRVSMFSAKDVILSVAPYSEGNYESRREVERFESPVRVPVVPRKPKPSHRKSVP